MRPGAISPFPRTEGQRILWALALMVALAASFIGTILLFTPLLGPGPARGLAGLLAVALGTAGLIRGHATLDGLGLRWAGLGAAVVRGFLAAAAIGAVLSLLLFLRGGSADVYEAVIAPSLAARLPFLVIGILAALLEEPIFRGYLQPAAMDRFGFLRGGFATALLFALVHGKALHWPPDALLGKLAIGLGLGALRGRDGSLVAPIVAHALVWFLFGLA